MKPFKIGFTVGVFDMLHIGHLNLLKKCKEKCDYLIVGLVSDKLAESYKTKPFVKEAYREQIISHLNLVDKVIIVDTLEKLELAKKIKFDVLFCGDDWAGTERYILWEKQLSELGIKTVFFPYTKEISSSEIRSGYNVDFFELKNQIENKKKGVRPKNLYFYTKTEEEKRKIAEELFNFTKLIESNFDVIVYPTYGTLLGFMRDEDFIKHDYDLDIAYLSKKERYTDIISEYEQIKLFLHKKQLFKEEVRTGQVHIRLYDTSDFWTSWIKEGKFYHCGGKTGISGEIDRQILFPFKKIKLYGYEFNCPNEPEILFNFWYKNWNYPLIHNYENQGGNVSLTIIDGWLFDEKGYEELAKNINELLELDGTQTLLDIGCGTGKLTEKLNVKKRCGIDTAVFERSFETKRVNLLALEDNPFNETFDVVLIHSVAQFVSNEDFFKALEIIEKFGKKIAVLDIPDKALKADYEAERLRLFKKINHVCYSRDDFSHRGYKVTSVSNNLTNGNKYKFNAIK